jgi:hypothetical protein
MVRVVVLTLNETEVAPSLTGTDEGTDANGLSEDKATETPGEGAGPVSVIVAIAACPPCTGDGTITREATTGGFTVIVAVFVTPANEADIAECELI